MESFACYHRAAPWCGYFAIMETAFSSASRIRLKAAADHGNRRAGQALYVLDHFDQAITTLLIGTNILAPGRSRRS